MAYYHVPHFCGIYYAPIVTVTPLTPPVCHWLPQVTLSTDCKLYDTSARTTLTQTFVNPSKSNAIAKANYNFPLYESCAVVAFRCFIEDRKIEGVAKGKEEAKAEYKEAVARGEIAGLLEQFTPDVFRTSLGNIPAGAIVKVEVEYIMELKHDAEVDGIRFTIPTSIAPRYGNAPIGLSTHRDGQPVGAVEKGGMRISVQITMPSNIRSVQSPSHPITMHLGGHVENVSDDAFNPKHALATLGQTSTKLGADFILLIKCSDLSSPRALLEKHPTKSDSKALMVTLVPKFTLPSGPKPEIVFVVDRSGSMNRRMVPLKSSLSVFLKSLPVGVKFNICSFGSSHSFLWNKSRPYSANTLEEAQKHVDSMDANLGGTEILQPIKATVSKRFGDLPLEIMVLTDGQVWDTAPLFNFIEKETAKGDARVFSLGIGHDVSHSLVEGMARVGRGFAQIVSDEKEGIEGKVVRMLRGGLSAHIKDYRLEWEGRPTEEQARTAATRKSTSTLQRAVQGVKKKISLFDKQADTDPPISTAKSRTDRFADLPEFVAPTVLQAPYKLPPLFPFSRATAYVILTGDAPSSIWLRGTTPTGDELELEIDVQVLPERGITLHQLAARKMLQELEEGTGYLHSGNYGVDKEKNPGTIDDWVEREGIRLGVEYGLASKWTSFVAVQKRKKEKEPAKAEEKEQNHGKEIEEADDDWSDIESVTEVGDEDKTSSKDEGQLYSAYQSVRFQPPTSNRGGRLSMTRASMAAPVTITEARKSAGPNLFNGLAPLRRFSSLSAAPTGVQAPPPPPPPALLPPAQTGMLALLPQPTGLQWSKQGGFATEGHALHALDALQSRPGALVTSNRRCQTSKDLKERERAPAPTPSRPSDGVTVSTTVKDRAKALIALQSFEGSFPLTSALASALGCSLADLLAKLKEFSAEGSGKLEEDDKKLWATLLAISMFESQLAGERDMWELVVEKAKNWISGLSSLEKRDMARLEQMASHALGA